MSMPSSADTPAPVPLLPIDLHTPVPMAPHTIDESTDDSAYDPVTMDLNDCPSSFSLPAFLPTPVRVSPDTLPGRKPGVFYGTGVPGRDKSPHLPDPEELQAREHASYAYTRTTYHDFIDTMQGANLDSSITVDELRTYLMKMIVGLSGNPDPRVAIKALEMLGKVKNIDIFERPSNKNTAEMSAEALLDDLKRLV